MTSLSFLDRKFSMECQNIPMRPALCGASTGAKGGEMNGSSGRTEGEEGESEEGESALKNDLC